MAKAVRWHFCGYITKNCDFRFTNGFHFLLGLPASIKPAAMMESPTWQGTKYQEGKEALNPLARKELSPASNHIGMEVDPSPLSLEIVTWYNAYMTVEFLPCNNAAYL